MQDFYFMIQEAFSLTSFSTVFIMLKNLQLKKKID